jgi:hypothetical protein
MPAIGGWSVCIECYEVKGSSISPIIIMYHPSRVAQPDSVGHFELLTS